MTSSKYVSNFCHRSNLIWSFEQVFLRFTNSSKPNQFVNQRCVFAWFGGIGNSKKNLQKLDMCLWNTDAPGGKKVKIWQKSLSPTFWPHPTPGEWDVSEVWGPLRWTYSPSLVTVSSPKLKVLDFVCKRDGSTDRQTNRESNRQTNRRMDGRTIWLLDAPGGPFRPGT